MALLDVTVFPQERHGFDQHLRIPTASFVGYRCAFSEGAACRIPLRSTAGYVGERRCGTLGNLRELAPVGKSGKYERAGIIRLVVERRRNPFVNQVCAHSRNGSVVRIEDRARPARSQEAGGTPSCINIKEIALARYVLLLIPTIALWPSNLPEKQGLDVRKLTFPGTLFNATI